MGSRKRTNSRKRKTPVEKTFSRAFENYRPPAELSVSEWAQRNRVLSRESSAEAGSWRNERTPYLVDVMDAFYDPVIRNVSVVASSQVGKSEGLLNIIGYIIQRNSFVIIGFAFIFRINEKTDSAFLSVYSVFHASVIHKCI